MELGSDSTSKPVDPKLGGVGSRSAGEAQYLRVDTLDFSKRDLHMGQTSSVVVVNSDSAKPPAPTPAMQEWEIDLSKVHTTVVFDRPIPLLRGPIPAGSSGYVLAFRSLESWAAAFKRCETLIREQCEEGARIGCAVSASNNCKPPWWQTSKNMSEREKCEEREFQACLVAAKDKCEGYAKDKCSGAFLDVRVAIAGSSRELEGLVWLASMPEGSSWRNLMGLQAIRRTTRRARDLLR